MDTETKEEKKLQIFISYGHIPEDLSGSPVPPVVGEIVDKIKKHKHTVWLDIENIPHSNITNWPTSDWRSAIYKAINNSDNVVGFLSRRSLRKSGVCLDELSIAVSEPGRKIVTVLLEKQNAVKVPPSISRIQWVDMSDWQEHYDTKKKCFADDGYIDEKFREIIDRIENEENFAYQYDMKFLQKTLGPSNTVYTDLQHLLKDEYDTDGNSVYENREWLKTAVDSFIECDKHYLLLTGGPGFGKSQFLAHCIHNNEDIYAYYFLRFDKQDSEIDCNLILRTIAFDLAAKMPDYRSSLIDSIKRYPFFSESALSEVYNHFLKLSDEKLFNLLFHNDFVHFIDGDPGKIVICIDALDEAEKDGKNPVIELFTGVHGKWPEFFKFILTSRNTSNIKNRFEYFAGDVEYIDLDVEKSDDDVDRYLRSRLSSDDIDDENFRILTDSCEKSFIYANLLVQSIKDGYVKLKTPDDIKVLPKGYRGLVNEYFTKAFLYDEYNELKLPLGIMLANGGSIDCEVFEKIMRKRTTDEWNTVELLLKMKSFVVLRGDSVHFYHKALNDWLTDRAAGRFYIDLEVCKKYILKFCADTVKEFNVLVETDYADATGFDLYEDAEENGYSYKIMKFVYEKCIKLMEKCERAKFKKTEIPFITTVLWMAYTKSELYFADEIFNVIKKDALHPENLSRRNRFYIAAAYNTIGEAEIARGNQIPDSPNVTPETVVADKCKTAIEYFWFIRREFAKFSEYGKLYASVMDNIAFNTRLMERKSPEKLNEAMAILNDLEQYELNNNFDGVEISLAHLYYHMGVVRFDMKQYDESLECLNKAEEKIREYSEDDKLLGDGLLSLVLNQRAACFDKLGSLALTENREKAIEYAKQSVDDIGKSLALKVQIHGKNSFYVAVAYDNLARFGKNYETMLPYFTKLDKEIYIAVNEAIRIKKLVFSEYGKSTARSYMTMAFCCEADRNYGEMIKYAQKAVDVDPHIYASQARALYNRTLNTPENGELLENALAALPE
jgi:tetratricopeptide (TPR) repeat protein